MTPLRSVLASLAERPDVRGAVVVSDEGLVIAESLPEGHDADAVSALTVSAQRALSSLAATVSHPAPDETVVSSEGGAMVLLRLQPGATLVLIANRDADLGALLYEFRRHAPALASLV